MIRFNQIQDALTVLRIVECVTNDFNLLLRFSFFAGHSSQCVNVIISRVEIRWTRQTLSSDIDIINIPLGLIKFIFLLVPAPKRKTRLVRLDPRTPFCLQPSAEGGRTWRRLQMTAGEWCKSLSCRSTLNFSTPGANIKTC